MLPAVFSWVQGCGWAGLRVSETASSSSGPTQVALGTTCLFHACFSHFQALSLLPPSPLLFLPAPASFCPRIPMLLIRCPTALPTSPERRDLYLDSHVRCRGSGGGRPGRAELDACLSSPSTRHPTAFACHKSQDTFTDTDFCPLTRVAYTPKHNSRVVLPDAAVLHHLLVSSPGGAAKSHTYAAHFPILDIFLKAPVPGDK